MPTTKTGGKGSVSQPQIDYRAEQRYMGIRTIAPFSSMFATVDLLLKELRKWVKLYGVADEGPFFLRYHVINMSGPMDIEVGFVVSAHLPGDDRVKPGTLPAGHYANLIYKRGGMTGNKALITWARANNVAWDRWDDPAGDAFRCRYEMYLTDYRIQPRKSEWEVNLAIKIADS